MIVIPVLIEKTVAPAASVDLPVAVFAWPIESTKSETSRVTPSLTATVARPENEVSVN